MLDTKYSPSRHQPSKRPRKVNTFSNSVVQHNDVGEFQGGYFIMPDETNMMKKKAFSPSRRKYSEPPSPSKSNYCSPTKKNPSPTSEIIKGKQYELITPALASKTSGKPVPSPKQPPVQSFIWDTPDKDTNKMNISSSATLKDTPSTPSSRWAGPAFSNAPPPSALPLPEFPLAKPLPSPSPPPQASPFYAYGRSVSVDSSLSSCSSYPPDIPSHSPPTLDQLSLDLRRMLNIGGSDPPFTA